MLVDSLVRLRDPESRPSLSSLRSSLSTTPRISSTQTKTKFYSKGLTFSLPLGLPGPRNTVASSGGSTVLHLSFSWPWGVESPSKTMWTHPTTNLKTLGTSRTVPSTLAPRRPVPVTDSREPHPWPLQYRTLISGVRLSSDPTGRVETTLVTEITTDFL